MAGSTVSTKNHINPHLAVGILAMSHLASEADRTTENHFGLPSGDSARDSALRASSTAF